MCSRENIGGWVFIPIKCEDRVAAARQSISISNMPEVLSIHIANAPGNELVSLQKAHLVTGKGIKGDHHFDKASKAGANEVTLVAMECVNAFNSDTGLNIEPSNTRRNIVTRGIDLATLVGKLFKIGEVVLEGVEPCAPCAALGRRLATDAMTPSEIVRALGNRGGLRAHIVSGGWIESGSKIQQE